MRIITYQEEFKQRIIDHIAGIQRNEFGVGITAEDQPDLTFARSTNMGTATSG